MGEMRPGHRIRQIAQDSKFRAENTDVSRNVPAISSTDSPLPTLTLLEAGDCLRPPHATEHLGVDRPRGTNADRCTRGVEQGGRGI